MNIRSGEQGKCGDLLIKHFSSLTPYELYEILRTRSEIFVVEQECAYQDIDGLDIDAVHIFCFNEEGRVEACLRVFMKDEDGECGGAADALDASDPATPEVREAAIGRVVTLHHGRGLGGRILHEGVRVARELFDADKITLEAQEYAIGYYQKEGFRVVSDVFMLDGISHVKMELS